MPLYRAGTAFVEPLQLTLQLNNLGGVECAEVVQLYVHPVDRAVPYAQLRPEIELRAFAKVREQVSKCCKA